MNGDRIVAVIAIIGMLMLVVPRLVNDPTPGRKLLRMVGLWTLIIVAITAVVIALT